MHHSFLKLVCGDALTLMEKANLEHHYSMKHAELDELQLQMSLDKVNTLHWSLDVQQEDIPDRDSVIQAAEQSKPVPKCQFVSRI